MADSLNHNNISTAWVDGELRLVGLDSRMIGLLRAIDQSGSINQAAKQMGLSYKGAWQIIERANNGAPKTLVSTATGGSKGGGTCLTEAGRSLLALFTRWNNSIGSFSISSIVVSPTTRIRFCCCSVWWLKPAPVTRFLAVLPRFKPVR